jgi:hypothetical protein
MSANDQSLHNKDEELTIHIACSDWFGVRERVHDQSEERPHEQHNIGEEAGRAEPEGTWLDVRATADKKAGYGDGVAQVQEDDTCGDHAAQS